MCGKPQCCASRAGLCMGAVPVAVAAARNYKFYGYIVDAHGRPYARHHNVKWHHESHGCASLTVSSLTCSCIEARPCPSHLPTGLTQDQAHDLQEHYLRVAAPAPQSFNSVQEKRPLAAAVCGLSPDLVLHAAVVSRLTWTCSCRPLSISASSTHRHPCQHPAILI
jgi:hypothetical protein